MERYVQLFEDPKDAVAEGYAEFNRNPTLTVDIPDGGFTISARTSEGKRVTFAFQPYRHGGPPQCVDVAYHDNGTFRLDRPDDKIPTFNIVVFGQTAHGRGHSDQLDTRKAEFKPGIVCVLMDGKKETNDAEK